MKGHTTPFFYPHYTTQYGQRSRDQYTGFLVRVDQEGVVMFTNSHQHAITGASRARRLGAGLTAAALATGLSLAGATSAQAADSPWVASSQATFLSGNVLGTNLDSVAELQSAAARVHSGDAPMTVKDPFRATALKAITVGNGSTIRANLGQFLQLGAIGEYATAKNDGTSMAQTGAVGPDGGVTVGNDAAGPGGDATLDLTNLLGTGFASNIASLQLAINAVAAKAVSDGKNASGTYSLAGVDLNLTSPAISQLTEKVNTALDAVTNRLSKLDGANGLLANDLNKALVNLNPALNLLGGNAHLTATINTGDLRQLVQSLLRAQYGSDGVTFNLETGVVTLNLGKLLGENLNSLAPGSELLNSSVLNPVLNSVTTKVSGIADQVVDRVTAALNDATVTVHADLSENVAQVPLVQSLCKIVQKVIQVPTQVVQQITMQVPVINGTPLPVVNGIPQLNGIPVVGGLLGKVTGTVTYITQTVNQTVTKVVDQTVDQQVCSNVTTALPALNTSVTADITGTVNEFLKGAGVQAKVTAKVLGVSIPNVNLNLATGDMTNALNTQLFGSDSAITDLVNALNTGLVNPAVKGLTGDADSVGLLSNLLSITVNNQEISDGTFTETAVRVKVLPGAGSLLGGKGAAAQAANGAVAQIDLARASVGPNVTGTVGGVDTYPPTDGNPGNPGDPGTTAASIARLATTGMGIAALVAAVLALLAAGAYLVRESYRR
ncbi:MAG: choice-of-anchor G family protein, partial [Pseudolysinimonas sp.]